MVGFRFDHEVMCKVPVWVAFPNLKISFWSTSGLSKVASAIGQLLFTDCCTAFKEHIAYARMLIEVDVSTKLPDFISVRDPFGNLIFQQVHYEWVPYFCTKCKRLGHEHTGCTAIITKTAWIPEATQGSKPPMKDPQVNVDASNVPQQEQVEQGTYLFEGQQEEAEQQVHPFKTLFQSWPHLLRRRRSGKLLPSQVAKVVSPILAFLSSLTDSMSLMKVLGKEGLLLALP